MRTSLLRSSLLATAMSVSMVVAGSAPVLAAEPLNVSLVRCYFIGGTTTVPAGVDINLRQGWGTKTLGQVLSFLTSVSTDATLNGDPITGTFGAPFGSLADGWAVFWEYPTTAPPAGDSIVVTFAWTLRHPVTDGYSGIYYGFQGVDTCTITGV